jgi:heme-degrading monooxygenase HmoA
MNRKAAHKPLIAETPEPPYFAVIFTSVRTNDPGSNEDYSETASRMIELAAQEEGFLGMESAPEGLGISVSYWNCTSTFIPRFYG